MRVSFYRMRQKVATKMQANGHWKKFKMVERNTRWTPTSFKRQKPRARISKCTWYMVRTCRPSLPPLRSSLSTVAHHSYHSIVEYFKVKSLAVPLFYFIHIICCCVTLTPVPAVFDWCQRITHIPPHNQNQLYLSFIYFSPALTTFYLCKKKTE